MALSVKAFQNRNTVILPFRLCIGVLFIYASLHKIEAPANFAQTIADFEVLPHWSINAVAVFLPWIELWTGICLVLGILVRSNALVLALLLTAFSWATLINVLRGSNIDCGCFISDTKTPVTGLTVVRDIIWLAMTATLVALERRMFSLRILPLRRL